MNDAYRKQKNVPRYPLKCMLCGPQSQSGFQKTKTSYSCQNSNTSHQCLSSNASTSLTLQIRCIQFKHCFRMNPALCRLVYPVVMTRWSDIRVTFHFLAANQNLALDVTLERQLYRNTFVQRCSYVFLVIRTVAARRRVAFRWDGNLIKAKIKALADWDACTHPRVMVLLDGNVGY